MTVESKFIVIGVQPITKNRVFVGFKYKALFPDRSNIWITDEQLAAADGTYQMIPEVKRVINEILDLHGEHYE